LLAIFCAVSVRQTVTVGRRPSGTLATVMPMKKTTAFTMSYPMASETMKNVPPDDLDEEKQIRIKFKKFFFDFLFSKEITNNFLV
jgi:hypothetical protein